ncbi:hypothetical protein DFH08DRAFT_1000645 [Mycena albidolilacea]|uniref:Uncharacterized protein n=1 Tax=Mycena albidolilacea TaxID=1033008 RepID=A0AAD7A4A4_9AGAR|nr:hypothetical protein DFH08DRAFT_1000645 [Mycena albidolilacea]
MAITHNTSACASSPTPSENSDMYYKSYDDVSSPVPSQTADLYGWDSDLSPAPMDAETTPTPQAACPSSPASVVEVSRDEFLPLATPAPTVTKPHTKATKATKGKGKAKAEGASLLHRPVTNPGSPSKRRRSNTAGDASPVVIPATVVTPASAAQAPVPAANPVALVTATPTTIVALVAASVAMPVAASVAAPTAAPAAAPIAAPVAAHAAAPVAAPIAAHVAAPAAAPIAAPAAALDAAPAAAPAASLAAAPIAAPAAAPVAAPATAPALPPLWLTADGLPPRGSYSQTPAGSFPPIVYSPEQLLQGVPADPVQMYGEVAFPKFFLVVSGGNGAVMKTHGLICEAIGNYINIDPTAFILGTPPTAANGSSSTLWLVADIPDPLAQAVIDAHILSSMNVTVYTLPYNMPVMGFVGVFAGFMLPNTVMGANTARDLISTAVEANNEIAQFVQTYSDAFGPQVSSGEAWRVFLAFITVHGIVLLVNDTNTVTWRLHVTPPTNDRKSWSQLHRLFGWLQIMTALYGTAQLQWAFRCRICPSIDHPTTLCPLPNLPGWLSPTPATIAVLEDASRTAAAKAQQQMRINTSAGEGGSNTRSATGRGQGPPDTKAHRGGKGKRGGDFKGRGKHRERDEFF